MPLAGPVENGGLAGASALLGKTVTVNGSSLVLGDGSPGSFRYGLSGAAATVSIQMTDATGKVVRTVHTGQQGRGPHQIAFDGLSDDGQTLPPGQYLYRVIATDSTGNVLPGTSTGVGPVLRMASQAGTPWLQVGNQYVPLSAVVGVVPRAGV
jgi:flagellar basal-body rod modification protein FlgD